MLPDFDIQIYSLEVTIIGGPASERFMAENPVVSRRIQMRGDQTLGDLHEVIFDAFDREDEHLYEFQIGGAEPNDPKARCYAHPVLLESTFTDMAKPDDAELMPLAMLGLEVGETFGYWFDFGDDWWHRIDVSEIAEAPLRGGFPKVTARVGASPPQHID